MALLSPIRSPHELIHRTPAALCAAGGFDRAMISRVNGSEWRPQVLHVAAGTNDPVNVGLAETVDRMQVQLTGTLVETTVLRRRRAMLVDRSMRRLQHCAALAEFSRSRSYVVAPIAIADRVIGFLHADRRASRRELGSADLALLSLFADLFGLLYEKTVTVIRIHEQHLAVAAALSAVTEHLTDLPAVRLDRRPAGSPANPDTGLSLPGGLTTREWEILRLVATGATNAQIAAALVVSEGTVKSHVKRVLHKLPAANRAEAVYQYMRLTSAEIRAS